MSALRVVIVDDERMARQRMGRLLGGVAGAELAAEHESGAALLAWLEEHEADVVLLDIHMPGLSGLEVARRIADNGPLVILSTAHPDHALEAFECGAIDYLVKPVDGERLQRALARARDTRARTHGSSSSGSPTNAGALSFARLAVSTRQGFVLLDPRHISHALLEDELVAIVAEGTTYLSDQPLAHLQERLPRELFERVHRRALLNLEHVVRLEPNEAGGFLAHTRAGHAVEVSRQAARELRKRLGLA